MNRERIRSINPGTKELLWEGFAAGPEEVAKAIDNARGQLDEWSALSFEERAKLLQDFAEILKASEDSFIKLVSQETGKPLWDAQTETQAMINKIAISIEAFQDRCRMRSFPQGNAQSVTRFKPHGVVAVLGPFNFPGHLPNGHIVPALLAGNTVVFKPSELTPLVGERLVAMLQESGIPRHAVNLIQGGAATGKLLAEHPDINGLFFTGSQPAGQLLSESVPPYKILALEMGGNNPLVVSKIADAKTAAYITRQSAYLTSGQRCTAARRLILIESPKADAYLDALLEIIAATQVGLYTDIPEPFMGPVINNKAAERLLAAQDKLLKAGGLPLVKMQRIKEDFPFLSPGLIDMTGCDRIDEEIFGPMLQLIRVPDLDAALKEANATRYGLSSGLVSEDPKEYDVFWRRIRAGVVNWNMPLTGASSKAPFGGVGLSGNHRPSAYFAADYCSYPVSSLEAAEYKVPDAKRTKP